MLRKGKWAKEEEAYASRIIHYFTLGMLPIKAGTTLRSHLSEKLHCDPMRITKKFAGAACIGKQVFTPCSQRISSDSIAQCADELAQLETAFLRLAATEMGPYINLLNARRGQIDGSSHVSQSTSRKRSRNVSVNSSFESSAPYRRSTQDSEFLLYEVNLFAASDLLLQFSKKIRDKCDSSVSEPDEVSSISNRSESPSNCSGLDDVSVKTENDDVALGADAPSGGSTLQDTSGVVSENKTEWVNSENSTGYTSQGSLLTDQEDSESSSTAFKNPKTEKSKGTVSAL